MTSINGKDEKILQLENRKRIFEIVKKNSGCHFREIERRSGIAHGTLKYHLNFLAKHGLIVEKKDGNNVRYFSKDIKEDFEIISLLRQKSTRQIILFLTENGKNSHGGIVDFVKLSPGTVSWHLDKLVRKGILKREEKFYVLVYPKEEIVKLLISFKESFFDNLVDRAVEMWDVS